MFGTIFGYLLCVGSALVTLGLAIHGIVKYSEIPESDNKTDHFVDMVITPFAINTVYTILAFVMMAAIPSFTWWMMMMYLFLCTAHFFYWLPKMYLPRPLVAILLLFVNVPGSVSLTAIICLLTGFIINDGIALIKKYRAKKEKEANQIAKDLGLDSVDDLSAGLDDLNNTLEEMKKEKKSKAAK